MEDYLKVFVEETSFYNRLVLGTLLPESWWGPLPHLLQGWLRNYIGALLIYFISTSLCSFYVYHLKDEAILSKQAMVLQISVAMKAMPNWKLIFLQVFILIPEVMPHVVALFIVPMHFATHIGLLFIDTLWTANIYDCIHGKVWPVMGAGYHTIHHTTYRHNYGHYTIWMDWMFGTLSHPVDEQDDKKM